MNPAEVGRKSGDHALDTHRARSNPLLAAGRLAVFSVWTAYCYVGCQVSRVLTADRTAKRTRSVAWTSRWLRVGARIAGIRVTVEGAAPDTASLIAPNHVGYLDIIAVGAACPVVFVSKADVRSWPIVGHLFSFSEHIGVARADRRSLAAVNASIAERLSAGMSVCVFLEGTSSCGTGLLPFHASLAQPAVDSGAPVVPVALRWESDSDRVNIVEDVAYWRPEHAFAPHAWRALGLRGLRVTVRFGQPIPATARDRKELAASAREQVLRLLGGAGAQA